MWWGRVSYRMWKSLRQKPHWLTAKGAHSPQWSGLEGTTITERDHPSPVPGHPCKTQNSDHLTRKHQTVPDSVPFVAFNSITGRKAEDRPRKGSGGERRGDATMGHNVGFWSGVDGRQVCDWTAGEISVDGRIVVVQGNMLVCRKH